MSIQRRIASPTSKDLIGQILFEEPTIQRLVRLLKGFTQTPGTPTCLHKGEELYPYLLSTPDQPKNLHSSRILASAAGQTQLPVATNVRPEGTHLFLSTDGRTRVDLFQAYEGALTFLLADVDPHKVAATFSTEEIAMAATSQARTLAHLRDLRNEQMAAKVMRPFTRRKPSKVESQA